MANKEATVYIIDAGPSMRNSLDPSSLQKAIDTVSKLLERKILAGKKGDHVEIVLVGTKDTRNKPAQEGGYSHITSFVFHETNGETLMSMPNVNMLLSLKNLPPMEEAGGCVMDGIIVAGESLIGHCKHYKFRKSIILLTDAIGTIDMDGAQDVVNRFMKAQIEFTLVSYTYKHVAAPPENLEFLRLFSKMECESGPLGGSFDGGELLKSVNGPFVKEVKPVATFRGDMRFGALSFPVHIFAKTAEAKVISAKKWSSLADNGSDSNFPGYGEVEMKRTCKLKDAPTGINAELDQSTLLRAYRYGKDLIVLTQDDQRASNIHTVKGITLLGFVKRSKVDRAHYMGNVLAVMPEPTNDMASKKFSALIIACAETDCVAIVKYVRSDNGNPKIGALIPNSKMQAWFIQLPYENDLKNYQFVNYMYLANPKIVGSKTSIFAQKTGKHARDARVDGVTPEIVYGYFDDLIDSMDLDESDEFIPKKTYNPNIHRRNENTINRVINPNSGILPYNGTSFNPKYTETALASITNLKSCFELVPLEASLKIPGKKVWKYRARIQQLRNIDVKEEPGSESMAVPNPLFGQPISSKLTNLSTIDPLGDFKTIFKQGDIGIIKRVMETDLTEAISFYVTESEGDQSYEKAMSILSLFRETSIEISYPLPFNMWMQRFKMKYSVNSRQTPFWNLIVSVGISLISSMECTTSNIDVEVSKEFLRAPDIPDLFEGTIGSCVDLEDDEDDLMAMMD